MSSSEKRTRRKFTPEFKGQAVKRVLSGHAVAAVARELGIGESLLHNRVTRHRLTDAAGEVQAEQAAEIARLKRALAQKEEEAAILKKAMAYFARESR
ncbi:hypothetical protein MYXO_03233 [Myxococcaceae bacterium]|nr:hypothetical protein MYXO_03233 [Myxococcaceae bacterium]